MRRAQGQHPIPSPGVGGADRRWWLGCLTEEVFLRSIPRIAAKLALPAALFVTTTGCVDFERLITHVVWSPDLETLHFDIRAQNLDADYFDCEQDGRECSIRVRDAMAGGDLLEIVEDGCENITERLEVRKGQLDLVVTCDAREDAMLALMLGVTVEAEGKVGKEKKHLVLALTEVGAPTNLPKSARHRVYSQVNAQEKVEQVETWSLKPSVTKVDLSMEMDDEIDPILTKFPDLQGFLKTDGLL